MCTRAFALATAGLLKGRPATTHHLFLDRFAREFPDVRVQRGLRFVESGRIATAGGLTSGIDLALHVVERYFGRDVAQVPRPTWSTRARAGRPRWWLAGTAATPSMSTAIVPSA